MNRPPNRAGRKPRSAEKIARQTFLPCDRCGQRHPPERLHDNQGLCAACWRQDWQAHNDYVRDQAIVTAIFTCSVWTPDLFGSELAIASDGCYIQRVQWCDSQTKTQHFDQQIACFEPVVWSGILAEAQALSAVYQSDNAVMDDIETHDISLRLDTQVIIMALEQGCCTCADGAARLKRLWMQIHALSQWRDRLQL